jgi:nitrile hydratase accessory protein
MSHPQSASVEIPEMPGDLAFPRKNGEPVFDAPWQSRAFGMVVKLNTQGTYGWNEFKARLIARIAAGECPEAPPDASPYYYQWVEAFQQLLIDKGVVSERELQARTSEFQTGVRQDVY